MNAEEAAHVTKIFRLYLELGCVAKLKARLDRDGVQSKARMSRSGKKSGGMTYSRGALYCLLQNPIYIGKICHRDATYTGDHAAIIPQELWEKVQDRLRANSKVRRNAANAKSPSLLVGLLFDDQGNRFTPFHADKNGKRYRYYVSQAKIHNRATASAGPTRIPAQDTEGIVYRRIESLLNSPEQLIQALGAQADDTATSKLLIAAGKYLAKSWPAKSPTEHREWLSDVIARIVVHATSLEVAIIRPALRQSLLSDPPIDRREDGVVEKGTQDVFTFTIEARVKRCGGETRLVVPADSGIKPPPRPVLSLIKAIARVHQWPEQIIGGRFKGRHSIAQLTGIEERYAGRILNCAFLAPDIVEAILEGRQPADLTVLKLLRNLPMAWPEQRKLFGFQSSQ